MSEKWDQTFDVVVGGSGAAAFAAAITAADAGLKVLMLESSDRWGGSSSMSGGGMWLPNNPLMQRDRAGDSREEALDYLEATVGDAGPTTSRKHKEAFVDGIAGFISMAERLGMKFARAKDYPDYYPELPGGKIGRAIEHVPFDRRAIGGWWASARGQDGVPMPVKTDDFWLLSRAWSTPGGMVRGAQVVGRTLGSAVLGRKAVGMGAALAASFLHVAIKQGTELWLSSPVNELIVENDRVVGVETSRDGRTVRIRARRGVILGGGGFDHNAEMRKKYQGTDGVASSGADSNRGTAIQAGERIGAALALMDDAWWGGSIPPATAGGSASFLVSERSMPFTIIVDGAGNRFANESESYVDLGHHMREHSETVPGKYWMICDARFNRRYLRSYAMDPRATKAAAESGLSVKAPTLAELARAIGVDPAALAATVERFNGFCRTGVDKDFGRGNSHYDRYYGDPLVHPNPNLGTLEKGPFSAINLVPGDLGTKGGLVITPDAQVVSEDGSVIEGLYAAGNNSASVMGRTYPGPGSTLGPAAVFGYRASRHIAGLGV